MAKAFSLASWNVEHFKGKETRTDKIVEFVKEQNPDIFALYEVEGKVVFSELVDLMPSYQFHITEGPQVQEILVGVKNGLTAFFTQRVEFKAGNSLLRPGALLSVKIDDEIYSILFLHTKSSSKPVGLGLRDDMLARAFKFKRLLDKNAGGKGKANFMFLGDLNVMGMKYPYNKNIEPGTELKKIVGDAKRNKMKLASKNYPHTWWNGPGSRYDPADLDQVVASNQLEFEQLKGADVEVRGWPERDTDAKKAEWINKYSDHALLFMKVQKV